MTEKKISKKTYLEWYESMQLMRRFEEKAAQLYGQGKIRGFCHLYIGQEAIVAGTISAIEKGDKLITAYRDHAHGLGLGMEPKVAMAELFGKATGSSKGKGGSMHFFSKEHNMFGGHGIVGAQIPLGAGIAFAEKYKKTNKICLTYMGDGAVRQGALHETFNMAMTMKIPVVFICENNKYAMGTPVKQISNVTEIYKLADAYDMPSEQVDGMSCEKVHNSILKAAKLARKEHTPTFIEMITYRYKGHSMSDPAKYRTKEELEDYKGKDPIQMVKKTIFEKKYASEKEIDAINSKIEKILKEAIEFADKSALPKLDELYKDQYMQQDYPYLKD